MEKGVKEILSAIKFDVKGLVPAIVQDNDTGEVLMLAYMNQEAVRKTLETGKVHFWSRSRGKLWLKGETSGNFIYLKELWIDCDGDALLVKSTPVSGVCHTGYYSCFYRKNEEGGWKIKGERIFNPEEVYGKQGKS